MKKRPFFPSQPESSKEEILLPSETLSTTTAAERAKKAKTTLPALSTIADSLENQENRQFFSHYNAHTYEQAKLIMASKVLTTLGVASRKSATLPQKELPSHNVVQNTESGMEQRNFSSQTMPEARLGHEPLIGEGEALQAYFLKGSSHLRSLSLLTNCQAYYHPLNSRYLLFPLASLKNAADISNMVSALTHFFEILEQDTNKLYYFSQEKLLMVERVALRSILQTYHRFLKLEIKDADSKLKKVLWELPRYVFSESEEELVPLLSYSLPPIGNGYRQERHDSQVLDRGSEKVLEIPKQPQSWIEKFVIELQSMPLSRNLAPFNAPVNSITSSDIVAPSMLETPFTVPSYSNIAKPSMPYFGIASNRRSEETSIIPNKASLNDVQRAGLYKIVEKYRASTDFLDRVFLSHQVIMKPALKRWMDLLTEYENLHIPDSKFKANASVLKKSLSNVYGMLYQPGKNDDVITIMENYKNSFLDFKDYIFTHYPELQKPLLLLEVELLRGTTKMLQKDPLFANERLKASALFSEPLKGANHYGGMQR